MDFQTIIRSVSSDRSGFCLGHSEPEACNSGRIALNKLIPETETQRDIHQRISDELSDAQLDNIHLSFYLTSIYDHSIYEAFSKIIQKLIPQLPTLENLLNILCSVGRSAVTAQHWNLSNGCIRIRL